MKIQITFLLNILLWTLCVSQSAALNCSEEWPPADLDESESKDDEWHYVPQMDGTFCYMRNEEINKTCDEFMVKFSTSFVPETDIIYYLYTRANVDKPEVLKYLNKESLVNSTYNSSTPTIFLIHGWRSNREDDVIKKLSAALLETGDFNVIGIDWSAGSMNIIYPLVRRRVNSIGPIIAKMIDFLIENGQKMDQVSVVGHSLGAQTAGIIGKNTKYGKLRTIIALDPAGPLFYADDPDNRLTPIDAEYVEAIHTNAGKLGFRQPSGQADFYPNGGHKQPGCGRDLTGACAHSRSIEYFIESINSNSFLAENCASLNEVKTGACKIVHSISRMGGNILQNNRKGNGLYYFQTNDGSPYSKGLQGISDKLRSNIVFK